MSGQQGDPYRWLEDRDSPETQAWLSAQRERSATFLAGLPGLSGLRKRFDDLFGAPHSAGPPDNNAPSPHADARLDPSGRLRAYAAAAPGAAAQVWRVHDLAGGRDLPDELRGVAPGGPVWTPDGSGLIYSAVEAEGDLSLSGCKLRHHRLRTAQAADRTIYAGDGPDWSVRGELSDDGRLLVIAAWPATERRCRLLIQDLTDLDAPPAPLVETLEVDYRLAGGDARRLWFVADSVDAPRGRLVAFDLGDAGPAPGRTIDPPEGVVFRHALTWGGCLAVAALREAAPTVLLYDAAGQIAAEIAPPWPGAVELAGVDENGHLHLVVSSPARPPARYQVDFAAPAPLRVEDPGLPWSPDDFVTERRWYAGRDGTTIPIWLSYRRGLARSGDAPTVLEVYGGFGEVMVPGFSAERLLWMELGGLWAQPCLRGGGEFGRGWHAAAVGRRRQVAIDDALAAAEWLTAEGWSSPGRLAVAGRSHGGLAAGACLVQRPGLFGAALIEAGMLDLLRSHQLGAGVIWECEYGDPENPATLRALRACSPLHGVRPGTIYPPALVIAGTRDDWVAPGHGMKFVAALQSAQRGRAPLLFHQADAAAHGVPGPPAQVRQLVAERLAFLLWALS